VALGAGCGSSGIGFTSTGQAYWEIFTDDSLADQNAAVAAAAAGEQLYVPANYNGGLVSGLVLPPNLTIACAQGATFHNPNLTTSGSYVMQIDGSGDRITNCTISGTEPISGAWYDVNREYDVGIEIFGGSNVTISGVTMENLWGTYALGTSPATNLTATNNTYKNNAYYGVQLAECTGCHVTNSIFSDSN
jgi:Right handed beta helix region